MRRHLVRRTTVIMVGLVGFLAGIGLGKKYAFVNGVIVLISVAALLLTARNLNLTTLAACLIFGLLCGLLRGGMYAKQLAPYQSFYGKNAVVELTATTDGTYNQTGQLSFDADNLDFKQPVTGRMLGKIKVETIGLTAVFRGDRLQASGKIYPSGGARQGAIKFASARVLNRDTGWINKMRLTFVSGMQNALPEPHASFGLGLLIGQRSTLSEDVTTQLSVVGLTHIIAVSGYNLTIIVDFVRNKLGKRSKFQILVLSLSLIVSFLLITGFSASIVRAAIVSGLGLGAWYYGRTFRPLLLLLLVAALTAGWYPVYLWSDVGWYLSFLAFYGVLILAPLVIKRFWRREPRGIMPIVIESACALIMTAPLVLYIFQQASLIALPANMLIVPLVPFAMFFVFVSGVSGMLVPRLAGWLAWPAKLLLGYILELVELLSRVPHALVKASLSLPAMIAIYGCVAGVCGLLWVKTKQRYGIITDTKTE